MIKVGKIIGDKISGSFNMPFEKNTAMPRQTVRKIILRHQYLKSEIARAAHTPETLYIMADEKFIPLQREKEERAHEMIKMAVIFEDIKPIKRKNGTYTQRNQIINKTIVANTKTDFWDTVIEVLYKKYDMEKVKNLYLMGDGAPWIKTGIDSLKCPKIKIKFGIDSFHFNQAIRRIIPDNDIYKLLSNYAYCNLRKEFKYVVNGISKEYPERKEAIQSNHKYIMNHWHHFQIAVNEIEKGCPMEQAVSHILASVFTSVAKAYGKRHLPAYINNRIIHQNNQDIRSTVLKEISEETLDYPDFDFSIFEHRQYSNPTIREFNKNIITAF